MRKKVFGIWVVITFFFFVFVLPVSAGQVVTKALSQWAKETVASEQTLTADQPAKSIAVLYYRNQTGNAAFSPLQKGVTVMLITDLSKLKKFEEHKDLKVVERVRLQAILEEVELGGTGLVDIDTAPRMGKLLGARYLAGGDILKGSVTELKMEPSMIDVPRDASLEQASAEGDLADLISMEKAILFEIVDSMAITLTPEQKESLETPLSTNVDALMDYFKGIESGDKGEFAKAAEHYADAVAKDPELSLAQEGIDEIEALDLLKEGAEAEGAKPGKWGKILKWGGIGAAVVAVGIGAYAYGEKKGKDKSDGGSAPPPPPGIVLTTPANAATDVSRALADVFIAFSKEMKTDKGRVTSSHPVFWQSPTTVTRVWEDNGRRLRIHRSDPNLLPAGAQIEFTLDGFIDKDGLELESYWFYFTTALDESGISIIW